MKQRTGSLFLVFVSLALVSTTAGVAAQGTVPTIPSPSRDEGKAESAEQQALNVELVGQIGGLSWSVAVQGDYAYAGVGPRLVILDVSDPAQPSVIGQTDNMPYRVPGVAVTGDYAFVANGWRGLRIIDVSDRANPTETGFYDTPGYVNSVAVTGDLAYVADGEGGLRIIDVSDPTQPTEAGFYSTKAYDVAVAGAYAYVPGLRIIDVSDPTQPTEAGFINAPASTIDIGGRGLCLRRPRGWPANHRRLRPGPPYRGWLLRHGVASR